MRRTEKDLLKKQVDVYVNWRMAKGGNSLYKEWLSLFVNTCVKVDILDVDDEDVKSFLQKAYEISPTKYERIVAEKAIKGIRTFYGARNKNAHKRGVMGRPPELSQIEKVQRYRKMGLKYREIERLTGKDVKQIHRWINYAKELKEKVIHT